VTPYQSAWSVEWCCLMNRRQTTGGSVRTAVKNGTCLGTGNVKSPVIGGRNAMRWRWSSMKRTKTPNQPKPTVILTGDWHLREDAPLCRTDDFWETQWRKVRFVRELQEKYRCPVIHSGDLFNHWKPSPYLLTKTMENLPSNFWTVLGNHDLPQNSMELWERSGVAVLEKAGMVKIINGCHWGTGKPNVEQHSVKTPNGQSILVWHTMAWTGEKPPWPGCADPEALRLLRRTKGPDLILTGHNHQPFVVKDRGRVLVNPGSLTRQTADQIDFRPRVYLWSEETNNAIAVFIPIDVDGVKAVSRVHLEVEEQRNERVDAFIQKLDMDWSSEVSFRRNLEKFFNKNTTPAKVESMVWESLEDV